ncbi:MAG: PEP-CTERM sorting domain-containing protein [Burkholderiales bacterium]
MNPLVGFPSFARHARAFVATGLLAGSLVSANTANASLAFTFDYSGNTAGVGFLDPVSGAARQTALTTAGNLFSTMFGNFFTNMGTINMGVTSTVDPNASTLASAFSNFVNVPGTFGGGEVIRNRLINGIDLNGAALDGGVDVNWGYAWELDPNTPAVAPGPGQTFDLYAALFHEFTHALGFGSEISGDPAGDRFGQGGDGSGSPGSWSRWDQFLSTCAIVGTPLVNGATYTVSTAAVADARANGGCFVGINAMAANGAGPVQLFANPDQSHLDTGTFPTAMMKPDRDYGPQEARIYNGVEVGILTDLGYTRVTVGNNVPEPGSIALILAGLAGLVLTTRRKA